MNNFFHTRLARHQKRMMRYLRYVFNDHFVLICFILLGGLGLYYSNFLKSLDNGWGPGPWVVLLIWWGSLHLGNLVTLAQPADIVFLLPKERQFRSYLNRGLAYSLVFPWLVEFLIVGISLPLLVVTSGLTFGSFPLFLLMIWGLKVSQLLLKRYSLYQHAPQKNRVALIFWHTTTVGILAIALFVGPLWAIGLTAVQLGVSYFFGWRKLADGLDWEKLVRTEQNRLHRMYQFINLFTDVPEITASVKRRKYLDGLLKKIPQTQEGTYLYLFTRRMLRGSEFSGLYFRLVFLGGLCIAFLDQVYVTVIIGCLFLYLIGFQLLPLYQQFQYMVLTQLYPIPVNQKQQALQKLLGYLLVGAALIFGGLALWALPIREGLVSLLIFVSGALGFTKFYVPKRLKKMQA